jgi:hypothetical protein
MSSLLVIKYFWIHRSLRLSWPHAALLLVPGAQAGHTGNGAGVSSGGTA